MCECVCASHVCCTERKKTGSKTAATRKNKPKHTKSINDWSKRINLLLFFLCGAENDLRRRNVVLDLLSLTCFFLGLHFCKTISSCVWDFFYDSFYSEKESILRCATFQQKRIYDHLKQLKNTLTKKKG